MRARRDEPGNADAGVPRHATRVEQDRKDAPRAVQPLSQRQHEQRAAHAWLVRPELFTLQPCFVAVETQGTWTSGTTVVDIEGRLGQPANANVALALDVDGFQRWVAEVLALAP